MIYQPSLQNAVVSCFRKEINITNDSIKVYCHIVYFVYIAVIFFPQENLCCWHNEFFEILYIQIGLEYPGYIKAILRDVMGEKKITFHFFSSYIYVMTLLDYI